MVSMCAFSGSTDEESAVAYSRGDFVFLSPENQTTQGFTVGGPSVKRMDLSSLHPEALGRAVSLVLDEAGVVVPHPVDWDQLIQPLLESAGLKTWNSFEKTAKCCGIHRNESVMAFEPTENLRREGFQSLDELKFEIPITATDEEIGQALLKAFDLSH